MTLGSLTYKLKLLMVAHELMRCSPLDGELRELLLGYNEGVIGVGEFGAERFGRLRIEDFEIVRFVNNEVLVVYAQYVQKMCANL